MTAAADIGVLICGHGSRDIEAVAEFHRLALAVSARCPQFRVAAGMLEFAAPTIADGLHQLRIQGCTRIYTIPGTLFRAGHAKRDIPSIIQSFAAQYPEIRLFYGRELGASENLIAAACARVRAAVAAAGPDVAPGDTALLVAGRGAADPGALADMQTIVRAMRRELGYGYAGAAYAGLASPLVEPALRALAEQGFKRIAVLPYFLFTGVLVKRIYQQTDAMAALFPEVQFVKAAYLSDHPLVIDGFAGRIAQCLEAGIQING